MQKLFLVCLFALCPFLLAPVIGQEQAPPKKEERSFEDLRNNWKTYESNLLNASKVEGIIKYEKQVIDKMLEYVKPINKMLAAVDVKDEASKEKAKAIVGSRIMNLKIMEDEFRRAESIRKLLMNIKEAGDKDMAVEIRDLPALSTQIYELQINLNGAMDSFRAKSGKLERQSNRLLKLKKDAEELKLLKKKLPDVVKKSEKK